MTNRNLKKELNYYVYNDPEYGEDIENIDYDALIGILQELIDRVEQSEQNQSNLAIAVANLLNRIETLEKDNELLKSYAWEQ